MASSPSDDEGATTSPEADEEPPIPPREDTQPIPLPGEFGDATAEVPAPDPVTEGIVAPPGRLGRRAPLAGLIGAGVAVLLLVVLLAVNATVAGNAEERAEEEARAALGVPAEVRLSGFAVGLRILVGAPVDARLSARDVPLEGTDARLTTLEIDAVDVIVDRRGEGALAAASATFVAELDEEGVQELVGIVGRIPLTRIELANGVARLSVAGFAVIDATADVEGGQVVLSLASPLGSLDFLGRFSSVPLELDALPLGFEISDVEIRRGVLRLRGTATDLRLDGEINRDAAWYYPDPKDAAGAIRTASPSGGSCRSATDRLGDMPVDSPRPDAMMPGRQALPLPVGGRSCTRGSASTATRISAASWACAKPGGSAGGTLTG